MKSNYIQSLLKPIRRTVLSASVLGLLAQTALAHLPSYEGERVRNDNHFTRGGFAAPVKGECDISAFGPTDPKAGSANIFLGAGNIPPNFFCAFTTQDDWSAERPMEIIDGARVPSPDPQTLGMELEEGYIPCNPANPNPLQCPREIRNPMSGEVIKLPGQCIDSGQPDDPSAAPGPDGDYHCALLPGAPRPRTSSVLFSTLTGPRDVDWAVYRYKSIYGQQPIVGAPQVPACRETIDTYVTFGYAGPLDMEDARSGKRLFKPLSEVGKLPREVRRSLPEGYGIRVTRPNAKFRASRFTPRQGYASGFAQNGWLLAPFSVVECIDDFEKCLADTTGELSQHYQGNDIFFVDENKDVDLMLMWWVDQDKRSYIRDGYGWSTPRSKQLIDVSITTGVIDQFIVGDFIDIGVTGPFSGNGRYIHGRCTDPRRTGKIEMTIETN